MLEQLATLNADGEPPESRLTEASKAYSIWDQLRQADAPSSFERARWMAMYDNTPPLNQQTLDANGQGYRVNVSWGLGPMVLEMAQSGYIELLNSTETFFECPTKYELPPEQAKEAEEACAEEITDAIRSWPDFPAQYLRNTSTFIREAVSFVTFDDEWDWRFDSKGLSDFKIPRKTKVGQSNIDVACWLRFYSASQLYQAIKDPEVAEANGWNVEAVRQAIMRSVNNSNTFTQWRNYEWEKLEIELRNNDHYWTYGTAQTQNIRVVHMVWQEFDGRYSFGIICDDETQKDWLCRKVKRFESSYNVFIAYTYGVGNDYYHGIRGQGYVIYPIVGALNRAYSQLLETGMFGSGPILQPKDESAMAEMQFTPMGPFSVLSMGMQVLPNTMTPNVSAGVLPIINQFTNMFREQTANANTQALIDSNKEMSAAEFNGRLASVAKMSSSSVSLFYPPWDSTLSEVVRRMIRRDYSADEPGGREVVELRKKLLKRGGKELLEVFHNLDTTRLRAKRAIGSGSEAARLLAFNQIMQILPYLPESGRQNAIRDFVAGYVTYRNADRYTSPSSSPTLTNQEGVAWTQNSLLMQGQFQPVLPNEDLFVHAKVHAEVLPGFTETVEANISQAAELDSTGQPVDLNQIAQQLEALQLFNAHMAETVQKVAINPAGQKLVAQYKQILQIADEVIHNGVLRIQKLMENQAAQQEGEQEPQIDPVALAKIENDRAKTEAEIESLRVKNETTIAKTEAEIDAKRQQGALNDAKTADAIRNSAANRRQKAMTPRQ